MSSGAASRRGRRIRWVGGCERLGLPQWPGGSRDMKGMSYAKLRRLCEPAASLRPSASNKQSRTTAAAFYGSRASRGALLMLNPFVAQETQRAARLCPARPAAKAWGNWCREAAAAHRGLCVHTYVHANTCVYRRLSRAADGYLRRGSNGGARRRIARSEASRCARQAQCSFTLSLELGMLILTAD